ncbi:hypothetical protein CGMCC3_g10947 [Colletotrichum fructicola]|nr:uncharacterized protein CGMCC3_g10947 [Colletotrichum fructicola]KAE9573153.1 hypothetical protein CGMCC3_g10947 [Colletotrichum fructicola]KAF4433065.1 hypothetical protein CFRS1_v007755 [Colletotrichum fructicola]
MTSIKQRQLCPAVNCEKSSGAGSNCLTADMLTEVQMRQSLRVSCQSRVAPTIDAVIDRHQPTVFAFSRNLSVDAIRFEQFCRHPPPLRLIKGVVKRVLARLLPCNADIWDFPSGLEAFLRHLLLWADINGAAFCGSLIYLGRALRRSQSTLTTEKSRHLRLLASIIVARKYMEDDAYDTPFWTDLVAGVSSFRFTDDDINEAERALLEDVAWDLSISSQQMYVTSRVVQDLVTTSPLE